MNQTETTPDDPDETATEEANLDHLDEARIALGAKVQRNGLLLGRLLSYLAAGLALSLALFGASTRKVPDHMETILFYTLMTAVVFSIAIIITIYFMGNKQDGLILAEADAELAFRKAERQLVQDRRDADEALRVRELARSPAAVHRGLASRWFRRS